MCNICVCIDICCVRQYAGGAMHVLSIVHRYYNIRFQQLGYHALRAYSAAGKSETIPIHITCILCAVSF